MDRRSLGMDRGRFVDIVHLRTRRTDAEASGGRTHGMRSRRIDPVGRLAPVDVHPVTRRRELDLFVRLPWQLYRDSANWVPPLISERKHHLDPRRNPFFDHAEAQLFLAWRRGEPVGRISAHIDHRFNEYQANRWGMFGFYESVRDQRVAAALLNAAERWLRKRGADRVIGPFDFSTNHECGLLIEGHELMPQILENWDEDFGCVAEKADGEVLGVSLSLPDLNKVLNRLNGRLLPLGWLRALREQRRIKEIRVFALGVKPAYQHLGVAAGLYRDVWETCGRRGIERAETGWVLETNDAMNNAMKALAGRIVKRYRIYERPIGVESTAAALDRPAL